MEIKTLSLENFRSHNSVKFDFCPKLNLFTGENGVGKTNIAEAIYYLSLGRSFRLVDDQTLIKSGSAKAKIEALIKDGDIFKEVRVIIDKDGRKVFINKKPIRKLSELSNSVNVILFEPKDVMLFKGSPKERRSFLDIALSKKSLIYFNHLINYEKVLKERNEILKQPNLDKKLLDSSTELLIKYAELIISYRQTYIKDINDILLKIARALTGVCAKVELIYKPFITFDKDFHQKAIEAYEKALEADLKQKATTIGIHREDFVTYYKDQDISLYGSEGENRLVALALKLSPYFLEEDKEKRPIVVLDDVMSELDSNHQKILINFLKKFNQVFITGTNLNITNAKIYQITK